MRTHAYYNLDSNLDGRGPPDGAKKMKEVKLYTDFADKRAGWLKKYLSIEILVNVLLKLEVIGGAVMVDNNDPTLRYRFRIKDVGKGK